MLIVLDEIHKTLAWTYCDDLYFMDTEAEAQREQADQACAASKCRCRVQTQAAWCQNLPINCLFLLMDGS